MAAKVLISIHALRKESDIRPIVVLGDLLISIHALRKESDEVGYLIHAFHYISIHALRKESDLRLAGRTCSAPYFNPRSP